MALLTVGGLHTGRSSGMKGGVGGLAVIFDMRFRCFSSMVHRVFVMTSGEMRMMRCRLVFSCFMMLCGFLVVSCRVFVTLCCLAVMLRILDIQFDIHQKLPEGTSNAVLGCNKSWYSRQPRC
jgi:hypothetical protein